MKKKVILMTILLMLSICIFAQEAVQPGGSNTSSASWGNSLNQYDYLLNPAYTGRLQGQSLFFALDNSGGQFGSNLGIEGLRAGWAVSDGLGFMLDYRTTTNIDLSEIGGEDTEKTEDDFQNIELTYTTYDQATGRYASITEAVSDNLKDSTHDHDLLFHSVFGIADGMAGAAQLLFSLHSHDTHLVTYTNTYSDTAAPTAATLTDKGDRVDTVNTLLDNNENDIALDLEFGMNTEALLTRAALGVVWNNLRIGNAWTQTTTTYNAAAGVDDTLRDSESVSSRTGQYYFTGIALPSFNMDTNSPSYLSTITAGIGSETELPMDGFTILVPFDVGFDFPAGTLEAVTSATTVSYNDAAADNPETGRTSTTTTTTLSPRLDMSVMLGGGIRKVFSPAENADITVSPVFDVMFDVENDTRTRTTSTAVQSDNNGNGNYTDVGVDTDTVYTESGWEIKSDRYTTVLTLSLPLSAEWRANNLMTFRAGYNMNVVCTLASISSVETGTAALAYEQYTDNLDAANSYELRQKDGVNYYSEPDTSFSADFSFNSGGSFGASLEVSDDFMIDVLATGGQLGFSSFTVMGIMNY